MDFTFLSQTAGHGLGLFGMMRTSLEILDMDWTELRDQSQSSRTQATWKVIEAFMTATEDTMEKSYNWARIINSAYLRGMTPKDNIYLAAVFGGIMEEQQPGVWNAEWAKGNRSALEAYRKQGREIRSDYEAFMGGLTQC